MVFRLAWILAWLFSLALVFVLGVFSAFTMYRAPLPGTVRGEVQSAPGGGEDELAAILKQLDESRLPPEAVAYAGQDARKRLAMHRLYGLARITDPSEAQYKAGLVADAMDTRALAAILEHLHSLPPGVLRDSFMLVFLREWSERDGINAVDFSVGLSPPVYREEALRTALAGWSLRDPDEAWRWVLKQGGDQEILSGRFRAVIWSAGASELGTAFSLVRAIADDEQASRQALAARIFAEFAILRSDVNTTLFWISELPEGFARRRAYEAVGSIWAESDPQAAMDWAQSLEGPAQPLAIDAVLQTWIGMDPAAAADWTDAVSTDDLALKRGLIGEIARQWIALEGPGPLAEWLQQRVPSPEYDQALVSLATQAAAVAPETALRWAQVIADPDDRALAEALVGHTWRRQNPAEARVELPARLVSAQARQWLLHEQGSAATSAEEEEAASLVLAEGEVAPGESDKLETDQ